MKNFLLALLAFITVWSCTAIGTVSKVGSKQPSIYNTQWIVQDGGSSPAATLLIEDNRIAGNAGCNSYFGSLTLNPNTGGFQASQIGATKKACPDMTGEANFLSVLDNANHYVVNGSVLELYKDNLLLVRFTKR